MFDLVFHIIFVQDEAAHIQCMKWSFSQKVILCSASDNSARIWQADGAGPAIELHHAMPLHKDVSAVDWSPDGNSLVTGAHDGVARIWSSDGKFWTHSLNEWKPLWEASCLKHYVRIQFGIVHTNRLSLVSRALVACAYSYCHSEAAWGPRLSRLSNR